MPSRRNTGYQTRFRLSGITLSLADIKTIYGFFEEAVPRLKDAEKQFRRSTLPANDEDQGKAAAQLESINAFIDNGIHNNLIMGSDKFTLEIFTAANELSRIEDYIGSIDFFRFETSGPQEFTNYACLQLNLSRSEILNLKDDPTRMITDVLIQGTDRDWVTGFRDKLQSYFKPKKSIRSLLYNKFSFSLLLWFLALPSILSFLIYLDEYISRSYLKMSSTLKFGLFIYVLILGIAIFKIIYNWICHLWPDCELEKNTPNMIKTQRLVCRFLFVAYLIPLLSQILTTIIGVKLAI